MALTTTIDPTIAEIALTGWLGRRLDGATGITVGKVQVPKSSGLSASSVLFDATWTQDGATQGGSYVARVVTTGDGGLFPSYDIEAEALIMRGLSEHTDVPAPSILFTETDPGVLGGPFIVMSRIDGKVPADDPPYTLEGWVLELEADTQRRMVDDAVAKVAALTRVDWRALGLEALPRVGGDAQIDYFQHLYDHGRRGNSHAIPEAGLAYLRENAPGDEPLALAWGDARLGNMLFSDDGTVAGCLDWEVASIGSREIDIAYFLFSLRLWSEGFGVPNPPGFPAREEVIARFEELSGHTLAHLEYYEIWAAVFCAVMVMRGGYLMIEAGLIPADSPMPENNPASVLLAGLLGIAGPTGAGADWAGKR